MLRQPREGRMSDQSGKDANLRQIEIMLNEVNITLGDVHTALTAIHEVLTTANTRFDRIAKITDWFIAFGIGILLTILGTLRNWF
jgi:hypothetical protein